jgi:hypothetical protein
LNGFHSVGVPSREDPPKLEEDTLEAEPKSMLRLKLTEVLNSWERPGMPARATLIKVEKELILWKSTQNIQGLWDIAPIMVSGTIDDAVGSGIQLIERYAALCGVTVYSIGVLASPAVILQACRKYHPDILGLTVLRQDQEDDLIEIRRSLPYPTQLLVGGPAAIHDPGLAGRVGIDHVSPHLKDFIEFLLDFKKIGNGAAQTDESFPAQGRQG